MRISRVLEALGGSCVRILHALRPWEALGCSFVRNLRALRPWEARTYVFYEVLKPPGFEGPGCGTVNLDVDWGATLARQTIRSTVGSTVKI